MIAVRETEIKKGERSPAERFYPAEMAFPLTGVPRAQLAAERPERRHQGGAGMHAALDRPRAQRTVGPRPEDVPSGQPRNVIALEIDLTTPLAYMWSRTDLDRYRWTGLLRPEHALERANLLLIRPYEPNKIPVVMVHGLISTPLAWIPDAQRAVARPGDPGQLSVPALHVPDRRADPDRRRQPARVAWSRPSSSTIRTAATRHSIGWSSWGTAWAVS